jgi:putative membrane protein
MLRDALLHFAHFTCIFVLASLLAGEALLRRPSLSRERAKQLQLVDRWYGIFAALVIVSGISLVFFGEKGASYYAHSAVFWTKMAIFVVIALISIFPTVAYLRWDGWSQANGSLLLDASEYRRLRRFLWVQIALFILLPLCAAMMANGISSW